MKFRIVKSSFLTKEEEMKNTKIKKKMIKNRLSESEVLNS